MSIISSCHLFNNELKDESDQREYPIKCFTIETYVYVHILRNLSVVHINVWACLLFQLLPPSFLSLVRDEKNAIKWVGKRVNDERRVNNRIKLFSFPPPIPSIFRTVRFIKQDFWCIRRSWYLRAHMHLQDVWIYVASQDVSLHQSPRSCELAKCW